MSATSTPHAAPHRADDTCRNCGARAPQAFCGQCGQETTLHPPTLREFVHEFVGHYVALEGSLWRSLALLLARAGRLTREYLASRRRRYVLPLRLYLSASFVFFLVLKLAPAPVPPAVVATSTARMETLRPVDCGRAGGQRFTGDPRGFVSHLRAQVFGIAPYVAFLLLPAFAGLLQLAYRRRAMTYGEHVVSSLHLHAFWYLALALVAVTPQGLGDLLPWLVPLHAVKAQHEVHGGGWGGTLARAAGICLAYGTLLLAATLAVDVALLTHG